jgi:hypothetical protein
MAYETVKAEQISSIEAVDACVASWIIDLTPGRRAGAAIYRENCIDLSLESLVTLDREGIRMSATLPEPELNIREQIARIDRSLAETHKFQAETDKLFEEGRKMFAENRKFQAQRDKLFEESRKFRRERWILVAGIVTAASAFVGSIGGVAVFQTLLRFAGHN